MVESLRRDAGATSTSDLAAVDALYREQAPRMWRALTAFTGSREVAQDAVAEAFAQVIRRGDEVRSVEPWVWRAAYRIAAGELKNRAMSLEIGPELSVVTDVSDEPAGELRDALSKLSAMQRAAVILHYYAGYPARDIAEITGSTAAAVWVHLSRARRELCRLLEDQDD